MSKTVREKQLEKALKSCVGFIEGRWPLTMTEGEYKAMVLGRAHLALTAGSHPADGGES